MLLAAAPVAIHKLRQRIQRVDILYEGAFINVFIYLRFYYINSSPIFTILIYTEEILNFVKKIVNIAE